MIGNLERMGSLLHQNVLGRYYTNSNKTLNPLQVTRSRERKISIPTIGISYNKL